MPYARQPNFFRPVVAVCGLPIDAFSHAQATQTLETHRLSGRTCFLSTPNLNFAIQGLSDAAFRDSVSRSDLSVADGMPLVWIAKLLGLPIVERVSGSGLFDSLKHSAYAPWKVFFFGGPQGAAQDACLNMRLAGGVMEPVGLMWPGFVGVEEMSRPDLIECINDAHPDLLVVSLGSAKGQAWIERNLPLLNVPVISHLGAVVNFAAGAVKRAPKWMQRSGLEWVWRIKEEPHLVTRYYRDGLALCNVMFRRVLPLALNSFWHRRSGTPICHVRVQTLADGTQHLALQGSARASGLAEVRSAWQACWQQGTGDVIIDLSASPWFDASFVALCLLLETSLRDQGRRLQLQGLSASHRRLLKLHLCEHLVMS